MRAFVILIVICFVSILTNAQETRIRWNENKRLQWNDFAGKANDTSWYDAECFAEIGYHYKFENSRSFQFDVFANFIKDISWTKKENQSEHLLQHEQLHFDIAELFSMKMKEMFQNFNYTENYQAEIRQLFDKNKQAYHAMQQLYDNETNHSLNKTKQKEWEDNITSQLM